MDILMVFAHSHLVIKIPLTRLCRTYKAVEHLFLTVHIDYRLHAKSPLEGSAHLCMARDRICSMDLRAKDWKPPA